MIYIRSFWNKGQDWDKQWNWTKSERTVSIDTKLLFWQLNLWLCGKTSLFVEITYWSTGDNETLHWELTLKCLVEKLLFLYLHLFCNFLIVSKFQKFINLFKKYVGRRMNEQEGLQEKGIQSSHAMFLTKKIQSLIEICWKNY